MPMMWHIAGFTKKDLQSARYLSHEMYQIYELTYFTGGCNMTSILHLNIRAAQRTYIVYGVVLVVFAAIFW